MKYFSRSELPPTSRVLIHATDRIGVFRATVDPTPAPDGKLYTEISRAVSEHRQWSAALAAIRRAGYRMRRVGGVSFTGDLLYELRPIAR